LVVILKSKKFWEELIAYFLFTVIISSDTNRNKTLACMRKEVNKQLNVGGCNVGITNGKDFRCVPLR
jgi:hypothetical protein